MAGLPTLALFVKRVYAPIADDDGYRVLVDRLWPRGLNKNTAELNLWIRDVGPSRELRQWYAHEQSRWETFRHRYASELDAATDCWRPLLTHATRGRVTLLYAARDETFNNAVALKMYLDAYLQVHGPR